MPPEPRRYQGEIAEWNDEKRSGFLRPRGSGPSDPVVYLPQGALPHRSRTPKVGDIITYELIEIPDDGRRLRTRLRAHRAQVLGEDTPAPTRGALWPLGLAHLASQLMAAVITQAVLWVFLASLTLSLISLAQHGLDKAAAGRGGRRVPEQELLLVALLGGWPGAALAQTLFRHKTQKESFQSPFRAVAVANVILTIVACVFLVRE